MRETRRGEKNKALLLLSLSHSLLSCSTLCCHVSLFGLASRASCTSRLHLHAVSSKQLTVLFSQGKCLDQVNVTHSHAYQQVEMNHSVPKEIDNMFEKLHKALHEVNGFKAPQMCFPIFYNVQLSELSLLQEIFLTSNFWIWPLAHSLRVAA